LISNGQPQCTQWSRPLAESASPQEKEGSAIREGVGREYNGGGSGDGVGGLRDRSSGGSTGNGSTASDGPSGVVVETVTCSDAEEESSSPLGCTKFKHLFNRQGRQLVHFSFALTHLQF